MHTVAPAALRSVSAGGMGSFSVTIQSESALTATIDLDLENWQELPTELEDEDELFFGAMQRHNAANGSKWDLMYELLESIRHAHPKARLEQARRAASRDKISEETDVIPLRAKAASKAAGFSRMARISCISRLLL